MTHPHPDFAWLEVAHDSVRVGRVRYALFDFDGTLSTIRRGWENVMIPLMQEMICGEGEGDAQIEPKCGSTWTARRGF